MRIPGNTGRVSVLFGLALLLLAVMEAATADRGADRPRLEGAQLQVSVQRDGVQALQSLQRSTIVQFPLVASGLKTAYPKAAGLVTVVRGDRDNGAADTVTVDVWKMPPGVRFTIFYTELAIKPFGSVEYVLDLTTRASGTGEAVYQNIAFVAFAMDARHPGTSVDGQEGLTSGTNLEHLGIWFSSLGDAKRALKDNTLTGTIFDGGGPPLHAGPQALTDAQSGPVF
jgi:hypothetical protein